MREGFVTPGNLTRAQRCRKDPGMQQRNSSEWKQAPEENRQGKVRGELTARRESRFSEAACYLNEHEEDLGQVLDSFFCRF